MEVYEFSNQNVFNVVFSIYVHLAILMSPMFASLALFTKRFK